MKLRQTLVLPLVSLVAVACTTAEAVNDGGEILQPVPFNQVTINDNFWRPRMETQKKTLVPFALEKTIPAVENLRKTGNYLKGIKDELPFVHRYIASDLYKVMEGAAYLLTLEKDPALEARMDSIIDIIADAQQADGYNYESHITGVSKYDRNGMGDKPYSFVVHSHELYNMGHMYEGAIAYYLATGKDKWLKVAEANARHINKVFFEGDPNYNDGKPINQAPGHQEIELALVKMYRTTGDSLYLNMAKKFIDIRGITYRPEGTGVMAPEYAQQHLPVREQTEALGHAVRATYLYSAMADVAAQTGDQTLRPALDSIWHNIVDTRMHLTGGLGAVHGIEGFGPEYQLPNKEAFCETCAGVGNVLFNQRMFLMEKDGKYMDVAEIALLNNVLAGVNLEGNRFFYLNPLEADGNTPFNHGNKGRSPWFGTACCPSNLARLIPQVSGMMYAHTSDQIYCAFYTGSNTELELASGKVGINQVSNYPFDENIRLEMTPQNEGQQFDLKLRIPTWVGQQFVPGDLYSYLDKNSSKWSLKVNGKKVKAKVYKGFATISRKWSKGDVVELNLPMPLRYTKAIDKVEADRGRIAMTRGPIIYCAEDIDNEPYIYNIYMTDFSGRFTQVEAYDPRIANIPVISVDAMAKTPDASESFMMNMIPYFAWNNRGDGAMMVWFPDNAEMVTYVDKNVLLNGKFKHVEASHTHPGDQVVAIADNLVPSNSGDTSIPRWTSWAEKGKKQWVEITLEKPTDIQSVNIYWYDDKGGVQIPQSWSLEYLDGGTWKEFPLYVTDLYNVFKDQFNMVHPGRQIITEGIRILITPKKDAAAGILEVNIEEVKN